MSGVTGTTQLEVLTDWLRSLGPRTKGAGMTAVSAAVEAVAKREYAASKGPRGEWPRRKADGAAPIQRPAAATTWSGKAGKIKAVGEDVLEHHRRRRHVFPPNGTMPASWLRAAEAALRRFLEKGAPK